LKVRYYVNYNHILSISKANYKKYSQAGSCRRAKAIVHFMAITTRDLIPIKTQTKFNITFNTMLKSLEHKE